MAIPTLKTRLLDVDKNIGQPEGEQKIKALPTKAEGGMGNNGHMMDKKAGGS